jgi:signal transduction histidine kinase
VVSFAILTNEKPRIICNEVNPEPTRIRRGRLVEAIQRSRPLSIVVALLLVLVVGVADYFSGYQIYWSIFYLMAISFALWNVGSVFALLIAVLSTASWLLGDWAAGVVYPNRFVAVWNTLITFGFYLVVIWLASRLKLFHQMLETRIRDRTAALRQEVAARERLEKEVIEVAERERRRIGYDLHDTLCQHLTATSLSLQVLSGKLAEASLPQAKDADQGVQLVENAIDLTRSIAKGLFPLELEGEGLAGALLELCRNTVDHNHIKCEFVSDRPVPALDSTMAMHLYRIAQEAVTNAVKHGHVSHVTVQTSHRNGTLSLSVKDDGIGLPEQPPVHQGLGLRIMASRADMIGGTFSVANNAEGGTTVTCWLETTNKSGEDSESA